jgi:hypothetical protein
MALMTLLEGYAVFSDITFGNKMQAMFLLICVIKEWKWNQFTELI